MDELPKAEVLDLVVIKAVQLRTEPVTRVLNLVLTAGITPMKDLPLLLSIKEGGGVNIKSSLKIPHISDNAAHALH